MSNPPISVFITVDTETSIGGAFSDPRKHPVGADRRIFCRKSENAYGISLMMDMADQCSIKLTFFLEVFNKYFFGEDESRRVCEYIIERGHDVQLHLHPNYLNFTTGDIAGKKFSDLIGQYPLKNQIEMIKEARKILISYGVSNPVAFRAGCFGADFNTLTALNRNGFLVDSSYNAAYIGKSCLMPELDINDIAPVNGVWEIPITCFKEQLPGLASRKKPMDINGAGFEEIRDVLMTATKSGPYCITIMLHSFSFVKPFDVQYSRIRPRNHVVGRFKKLLDFFKKNEDIFEVKTFDMLSADKLEKMSSNTLNTLHPVKSSLSVYRSLWQLVDRIV
ncbi:polysaccharide deacetylase family protein [Desulfobacula phenolica]|uniref:Polysaccharide deacetylase n=1 Tax=Desulfobacula phenolica TaxID=90732 RepID=A0A1H2EQI7_9BACT|nr:hypothetical protein [Desulfobacula phenolica]SDT96998.1 hypothetical protein SAMN04487931_103270 [Desulfobacula phenolica]